MDFDEGNLKFSFDASWQVVKYDDSSLYRKGVGILRGTKAVDFIGLQKETVFFIEVKDFRGHRIENQNRLIGGDLAIEIGQKVRDSVAGLIGAHRTSSDAETISPFVRVLLDSDSEIKVVVWLEHDLPDYLPKREKVKMSVEGNVFKQKLRWLTSKVLLSQVRDNVLKQSGLTVRNLPFAPQTNASLPVSS
jgi:hypothetical protein